MARINIRYFVKKRNPSGGYRYYWQPSAALKDAGWKTIRLASIEHEAIAQAEGINRHVDEWRAGLKKEPDTALPGSLHATIEAYKKSPRFKNLAEKTQKDYAYNLETIREWAGDAPIMAITGSSLQNFYDKIAAKHPRKAMFIIQVMSVLFSFAAKQRQIPANHNPAATVEMAYKAAKGTIWSAAAVQHFVKTADAKGYFGHGTAVMVNEWIGQRRGDILSMTMDQYQDGELKLIQSKTGAEVEGLAVGEIPELKKRIEEQIRINIKRGDKCTDALIQQDKGRSQGRKYEGSHFRLIFDDIRTEAAKEFPEVASLVFKDLRHTAVTRLAEAGAEIPEIASVTGHSLRSCQGIVDRYNVRTRKMARNALIKRKQAGGKS